VDSCLGRFDFDSVQILKGSASSNQYLVEKMSENLRRTKTDLLVVLSNNRTGLPHWFLGSFAETAALAATCSVLVVKPHVKGLEFSSKPSLTVALDASAQYTPKHIKWIADFALPAKARIDVVCVKPGSKGVLSHLRKPKDPKLAIGEIKKFDRALKQLGLVTTLSFIGEKGSVAETISSFADRRKSSVVLTIATERKAARRILIGSTARRVLTLTKRPFISLRLA
jgi:nucleotide-binding universal stress UspA family protein